MVTMVVKANAHTLSYDKKDNVPDNLVRLLGRTLGWEMTTSLVNDDIITSYLNKSGNSFSGQSRGLSINEKEIEFWRRLIINTPWIWKSKGTRKVIEMFFKLIGAPTGLYEFNEYIYTAEHKIDIDLFIETLLALGMEEELNYLNIDSEGFPKILRDTPEMYFQKAGLWYRQTGGVEASIDLNTGNNPHIGPYDGGQAYIDQFSCLIPGFSAVTIHREFITTGSTNLYINDSAGDFNGVANQETVVTPIGGSGLPYSGVSVTSEIVESPKPRPPKSNCGCDYEVDDKIIKIDVKCSPDAPEPEPCNFIDYNLVTGELGGVVEFIFPTYSTTLLNNFPSATEDEARRCCIGLGYTPMYNYNGVKELQCVWGDIPCETPITFTLAASDETDGSGNGVIAVTNVSGNGPWEYLVTLDFDGSHVTNGISISNIFNITGLVFGIYNVKITDSDGCVGNESIKVGSHITCNMTFDLSSDEGCVDDGVVHVSNVIGVTPYTYYIDNNLIETTNNDYYNFYGLTTNINHSVKVVDSNDCENTSNIFVNKKTTPLYVDSVRCSFNKPIMTPSIIVGGVTDGAFNYELEVYVTSTGASVYIEDPSGAGYVVGGATNGTINTTFGSDTNPAQVNIEYTMVITLIDTNGCRVEITRICEYNG